MSSMDIVIVGGGPAGYVAAIRAAQLGRSVALVEEEHLGGTCLNRGCIPTKTLAFTAEMLRRAASARRLGLSGSLECDWPALARRKDRVVRRLRKGIEMRLQSLGVELVRDHGILLGAGEVAAGDRVLGADNVLLAPGSVPMLPGPLSVDGVETSRELLSWDRLPESLILVGGGVIGCELASILSAMGVRVTVVEMLDDILPGVDRDVTAVVRRSMEKGGATVITGNAAQAVTMGDDAMALTLRDGTELTAERLVVAVGRSPRTQGMGLSEAGIQLERGLIRTDRRLMTTVEGVYAAGDATGPWQLAHAASAQGLCVVESLFAGDGPSREAPADSTMPACIFTHPEVATVGPGEEELGAKGVAYRRGTARYIASGRAVGMDETAGFLKLLAAEEDGRILGVQIVGAEASSLIGEACAAVSRGITAEELAGAVHPHPTLTELMMEAAEDLVHGAIHG